MTAVTIGSATLHLGDCRDVLKTVADASIDAIVTDPPYELGFMGRDWDRSGVANDVAVWAECLRVLKPGGHLLAFSGARTYHRMACAIEDAGFELRDQIMWIYGSGFPKSLDVSKAIDKVRDDRDDILRVTGWLAEQRDRAGLSNRQIDEVFGFSGMAAHWTASPQLKIAHVPRWDQWLKLKQLLSFDDEMDAEVWRLNDRKGTPGEAWKEADVIGVDRRTNEASGIVNVGQGARVQVERQIKAPNSEAARQWSGWGTALKPAHEPIVVARKPLVGTVAANVLEHGTGALNIDACRVPGDETTTDEEVEAQAHARAYALGRWPANVIHDGSDDVLEAFAQFGDDKGQAARLVRRNSDKTCNTFGVFAGTADADFAPHYALGSAARFFYCAKATRADRNEGLDDPGPQFKHGSTLRDAENLGAERKGNHHPTVKPTDLMAYLCRLVTPPGGTVLDPFMGSGSTGKACAREGLRFVGVEQTPDYVEIARARIEYELERVAAEAAERDRQPDLF
ncbi:DNA methyltransferase [Burkholderia pseudomallei]|uniref:DNA methyltransferase n=1 Tax=Burkholderia pseudomallei TaxID=28450 RepID=UPI00061BBEE6|nr:DNA methyltransferase [Burkholderia pseudomallei]BEH34155.1 hypothetical protein GTC054_53710 [Burkholderia pseudomallei]CPG93035.1 DNA methylase [Burkholderia pseudomallei]